MGAESLKFKLKGRPLDAVRFSNLFLFSCENGWIHAFNGGKPLWTKKLVSTYYRGPFNDVNALTVDTNGRYVAVGTDFADGKVYLFDMKGKRVWERQMVSVLGCWERPDDVEIVRIDDSLVVSHGFVKSYVDILSFDGDIMETVSFDEFVRCIRIDDVVLVGTDRSVYEIGNGVRVVLKTGVIDVMMIDGDLLFTDGKSVFFGKRSIKLGCVKSLDVFKDLILACCENRVYVLTSELEILSSKDYNGKVLKSIDGTIIVVSESGANVESIE